MVVPVTAPVALLERDAVAAGAADGAVGDAQGARVGEMNEPAACRQLLVAALQGEARQRHAVGMLGRNKRAAAGEGQIGGVRARR